MRYKLATQTAEKFLADRNTTSLPVDPVAIAESLDIVVEPKPDTAEGVSGMLVRHQDIFGIMYATHIDNEGFQRFSIAHEIGHYVLAGHVDHIFPSGDGLHSLPIRLMPMTATYGVPPLSRVKLGIGWSRGVARDAEQ